MATGSNARERNAPPGRRPASAPSLHRGLLLVLTLASATLPAARATPVIVDSAQSHLEIAVKSTIDSFVAHLGDFAASIEITPQTGRIGAAVFRFNFAAVKTGNPDRDRDMNEWQQTDRYPEVVFTLLSLDPAAGERTVAHGRLVLHGVEKSVSFPVSIDVAETAVMIDGDAAIDTRDYGLPVIRKYLFLKVDPVVAVHFHLQGRAG